LDPGIILEFYIYSRKIPALKEKIGCCSKLDWMVKYGIAFLIGSNSQFLIALAYPQCQYRILTNATNIGCYNQLKMLRHI